MGYLKKIRDAKIRNGRPTRQERLDCEESETERRTQEYDDAREDELTRDIVTSDIVFTPKETQEDLGACGSYGERLYDEGTELCDCCELSDTCFANYKLWRKEKL